MRLVLIALLLLLAAFIYLAKSLISNEKLERLANAVSVVSLVAALLVFVIPAATPEDPGSQQETIPPTVTFTTTPLILTPSATVGIPVPTINTPGFNHLIYEENFEDQTADPIETIYGHFNIVQTADGNHVWRTLDNATSQLILPTQATDYTISARIMQVSGEDAGQGTFWLRRKDGGPGCPAYLVYMVVLYDQVRLVEKDSDCNELQDTGLYEDYYFEDSDGLSNGVWYTVRIEVKGVAVRVYWDGELIIEGEDTDGDIRQSNVIGFAACCGNENSHTFDFDDIQVWISDP